MNQINSFSIKSVLELQFNTSNIRNISYDSFLPEFNKLQTWFIVNKLSLNVNKTNYIVFGKYNKRDNIKLYIDTNEISRVNDTKFLGVYIDSQLSWSKHIDITCNKLSRTIGILCHVRPVLNTESMCMLYC